MKTLIFMAMVALLCVGGCDRSSSTSSSSGEAEAETFESPQVADYTRAGRPFAQAIFKKDYAAAYQMLHPLVRQRFTLAQFTAVQEKARTDFFAPASAEKAYVSETDPAILSGRVDPKAEKSDQVVAAMEIARLLGNVPDYVPVANRRAVLTAALYDRDPEDVDCRCIYLNYLLVEDHGQYSIAHWFYRWHDMLD